MSAHKSLKAKGKLVRTRNVLNRWERIEELTRQGRWIAESNSPYGLPKVRVLRIKKRAKEAKKKEEAAAPAAAAAAAPPAS
jgi:small basic protein (TIGR04137 family)